MAGLPHALARVCGPDFREVLAKPFFGLFHAAILAQLHPAAICLHDDGLRHRVVKDNAGVAAVLANGRQNFARLDLRLVLHAAAAHVLQKIRNGRHTGIFAADDDGHGGAFNLTNDKTLQRLEADTRLSSWAGCVCTLFFNS